MMKIPLKHVLPFTLARVEQALVIKIAMDRSKKWREFIDSQPLNEAKWYNEIVDYLVESYPDEFYHLEEVID